jgi:teichuronic acid biosynthesis glycosyltransferase TuaC
VSESRGADERYRPRVLRVLVVSNMLPDAGHPERGGFVRDQVAALRRLSGIDVELYEFPPGGAALVRAARELRRRDRRAEAHVDVVHAHFGLTAWPALAAKARVRGLTVHGTDVRHPRTRLATRAALPLMDLIAAPTPELARELPGRTARRRARVLPCGVDMERFRPIPRTAARVELGLDPHSACMLFPADPARPSKRYDRALALAKALARDGSPVQLHALGGIAPERVPLWVNAVNAVVVPSEAEGFGLAALEALACDVPVLATPVGVHSRALAGVAGALCAPFDLERWQVAATVHVRDPDPRIAGREHAEPFSSTRIADHLADAWRKLLEKKTRPRGGSDVRERVAPRYGEPDG